VTGFVKNGELALPGASITVRAGDRVVARTSTDLDGSYVIALAPGAYTLRVELSVFAPVERPLTVGDPPCDGEQAVPMALASRTPGAEIPSPPVAAAATAPSGPAGAGSATTASAGASGPVAPGGRGGRQGGAARFGDAPRRGGANRGARTS
jgi:hypothetical protein